MDAPDGTVSKPAQGSLWPRAFLALVLLGSVVAFFVLGWQRYFSWEYLRENLTAWQTQARENPLPTLGLFFAVYVAVTTLSLPVASLLGLMAGALFGRWLGTGIVSLASTLGATLAFLCSRYLFREAVQQRFGRQLSGLNEGIERKGAYYLFTLRLVPFVPFFLVNLGMGLTPIPLGVYVLVSWLGMLPGTFLYVNAGTELATLESPAGLLSWPILTSLVLLGVVPLLLRRWMSWPQA